MTVDVAEKESRRIQRISLPLPSRVEVKIDGDVSWNEITRLSDVSAFGAGFSLKRPIKRGRLVFMTIPMPRQLRCYDFSESQYKIWGLVRRCTPVVSLSGDKSYSIGVAFIGKSVPQAYFDNPANLFDISHREEEGLWHIKPEEERPVETDLPKEARRQTRFFIPEAVTLEIVNEAGEVVSSEMTVTENISLGGAAVFTSLEPEPGSFIRVSSQRTKLQIISVVRGRRIGPDGLMRLHLEFIDNFFPLEGIE